MVVDAGGVIAEAIEENNLNRGIPLDADAVTVIVPPVRKPDLLATRFDVSERLAWGRMFGFSLTIANRGGAMAQTGTATFYLSFNRRIGDSDDYVLATMPIGRIAAGRSRVYRDQARVPYGGYIGRSVNVYIAVVVDQPNRILEFNETNNRNRGLGLDSDRVTVTL